MSTFIGGILVQSVYLNRVFSVLITTLGYSSGVYYYLQRSSKVAIVLIWTTNTALYD